MDTDAIGADIFDDALRQERCRNARRVNLLRFRAVSLFFAINLGLIVALDSPGSLSRLPAFACYWLVATAVWLANRRQDRLARLGSLPVSFIDMPPQDYGFTSQLDGSERISGRRWLNIWDKDDPIAWPVEALMDTPRGKQYAEDAYVDVSDFVGKAHDRYWRSRKVHEITAERG